MADDTNDQETPGNGSRDGDPRRNGRKTGGKKSRRLLKWSTVAALAVAVAIGGYLFYRHEKFFPGTSDAYIKADAVEIAPQVSGRLIDVPVNDQQAVDKGDLLFRIDPQPFQDRVAEATAALANARQKVAAEQAAVNAAQAEVAARQATLKTAQENFARARDLVAQDAGTKQALDDARAAFGVAKAQLALAEAQLNEARKNLGTPGERNNQIEQANAVLDQAKLDLAHTWVRADCRGRLSGFTIQRGDILQSGGKQGVLVCNRRFWVYANFKETDLTRIRPGQKATVDVDMYPNHPFHGIVESIDPASGTAFSLLPPENATGNWVKVTQRVPVRILITDDGDGYPLRVQTSAEVTVDTGTGAKPLGEARNATISDAAAMKLANGGGSGN